MDNQLKIIIDDNTYVVINIFCNIEMLEPIVESTGEQCDIEKKIFAKNLLDNTFSHVFDCKYDGVDDLKIHRDFFRPEIISTIVDNKDGDISTLISVAPVLRYSMIVQSEELKPCNATVTYIYNGTDFLECSRLGTFASQPETATKWFEYMQTNTALKAFDNIISNYEQDDGSDDSSNPDDQNDTDNESNNSKLYYPIKPCIVLSDHISDDSNQVVNYIEKKTDDDIIAFEEMPASSYINEGNTTKTIIVHDNISQTSLNITGRGRTPSKQIIKKSKPSMIEITKQTLSDACKSTKQEQPIKQSKQNKYSDTGIFIPKKLDNIPILNKKVKEKPFVIKTIVDGKNVLVTINEHTHLNINKKFIELNKSLAQKLLGINYITTVIPSDISTQNSANLPHSTSVIYNRKTDKSQYLRTRNELLKGDLGLDCLKLLFQDVVSRYNVDIKLFMNKEINYTIKKFMKDKQVTKKIMLISLTILRKRVNLDGLSYSILNSTEIEEFMSKEHFDFKIVAMSTYNNSYCIIKEVVLDVTDIKLKY
jgi:hypothetical protein